MHNINDLTQDLVDETLEFLQDSPLPNLDKLIYMDELYEKCYDEVNSRLADESEARADIEKYEDYDEQDS